MQNERYMDLVLALTPLFSSVVSSYREEGEGEGEGKEVEADASEEETWAGETQPHTTLGS